jgi:hypothetical protein
MDRPVARNLRAPTRLPDPKCPQCGDSDPVATLRTEFAVYFRCENCYEIWVLDKPTLEYRNGCRPATPEGHCQHPHV